MKKLFPFFVIGLALIFLGMDVHRFIEGTRESKATVMVKAQAADAECTEFGTNKGVEVALCTLPSTPNKDTYVSVYGHGPWQVFQLKAPPDPAQQTAAKATPAPTPAPADAGAGSGSGSGQGSGKGSGSGAAKK